MGQGHPGIPSAPAPDRHQEQRSGNQAHHQPAVKQAWRKAVEQQAVGIQHGVVAIKRADADTDKVDVPPALQGGGPENVLGQQQDRNGLGQPGAGKPYGWARRAVRGRKE